MQKMRLKGLIHERQAFCCVEAKLLTVPAYSTHVSMRAAVSILSDVKSVVPVVKLAPWA